MAGSPEAIEDLKMILEGRAPFYAKADMTFDTSTQPEEETFQALRTRLRSVIQRHF
jgi:XRE family aerobic/anaerobic benzoate catabolism transcriptional regulator